MNAKDAIKHTMNFCREITLRYTEDMSDTDLFVRPVPAANHIAWQMGHLVAAEHEMMTGLGHQMPALPDGFAEAYTRETAKSNGPAGFLSKNQYLDLMKKMRAATLAAVDATNEADLDQPAPESMRDYAQTIGAVLTLVGTHELMHAGQYVVVRRKLGKPILF